MIPQLVARLVSPDDALICELALERERPSIRMLHARPPVARWYEEGSAEVEHMDVVEVEFVLDRVDTMVHQLLDPRLRIYRQVGI